MTVPGTAGLRMLDISLRDRLDATVAEAAALASAGASSVLVPLGMAGGQGQEVQALSSAVRANGGVPAAALPLPIKADQARPFLDRMLVDEIQEVMVRKGEPLTPTLRRCFCEDIAKNTFPKLPNRCRAFLLMQPHEFAVHALYFRTRWRLTCQGASSSRT